MLVSRKRLKITETFFQEEMTLELELKAGLKTTLLEALNANKVSINQSCGGNGTCGTCRVEIVSGINAVEQSSSYEQEQSIELQLRACQRLACQTEFSSSTEDLHIKIVNEAI